MTARHSGKLDEHGSCDNAGSYSSDTEEDSQPVKNGSGAELTIGEVPIFTHHVSNISLCP